MLMSILTLLFSVIYTESVGYFVHRWLHKTDRRFFKDLHMEHHLMQYPAKTPQQTQDYRSPLRYSWVDKIGLEWIIPTCVVTAPVVVTFLILGMPTFNVCLFLSFSLCWAWLMFDYLHRQFHLKKTFVELGFLKLWFRAARKMHFVHHNNMTKNFGIGFFWFDRLFKTLSRKGEK